jgi:hypothetical protein
MGIVYEQHGEEVLAYIVIDCVRYYAGRFETPATFVDDGMEDM